jgi:hypothetical protein
MNIFSSVPGISAQWTRCGESFRPDDLHGQKESPGLGLDVKNEDCCCSFSESFAEHHIVSRPLKVDQVIQVLECALDHHRRRVDEGEQQSLQLACME